jgi:hypothetical protein
MQKESELERAILFQLLEIETARKTVALVEDVQWRLKRSKVKRMSKV